MAPSLSAMESLAPRLDRPTGRLPARIPARGPLRATVGLLTGCVQGAFFPQVNAATARVLALEGCDVVVPREQGCCGALSVHSGREAEAKAFARHAIKVFEDADVDHIVVNAAGCGSSMKEYGDLFADEPEMAGRAAALAARVRDVSEILVELGPVAERHPLPLRVAYHDACHLAHAQGVRAQPRALLSAIPGVELAEIAEAELCCGSAGVYNLLNPDAAQPLGDRKAANITATRADLLVTANPGCLMQVAAAFRRQTPDRSPMSMAHTIEVLDASLRGRPVESLVHGSLPTK
jgi:glycolate oxidase iron-sulfur subunit